MNNNRATAGGIRLLLIQGLRFGAVGGLATFVHLGLFVALIELAAIRPFWANFPAFAVALVVGFTGHFLWTFRRGEAEQPNSWMPAFAKFSVTALLGLAMNSGIVYGIVDMASLPYGYAAALMATATPAAIFLVSKFWAFT